MRRRNFIWIMLSLVGVTVLILFLVREQSKRGDKVDSSPSNHNPADSNDSSSAPGDAPAVKLSSWVVRNKYGDVSDPRPEKVKPRRQGYNNRFQIEFYSTVPKSVLTLKLLRDDVLSFQFFTDGETNGSKGFNYFEVSNPKNGTYTLDLFTAGKITDVKSVFELQAK